MWPRTINNNYSRASSVLPAIGGARGTGNNIRAQVSSAIWRLAPKSFAAGFTIASLIDVIRNSISAVFDKRYSETTSNKVSKAVFDTRFWSHLAAELPGAILVTIQLGSLFALPTWASTIICPILKLALDWMRNGLGVDTEEAGYLNLNEEDTDKKNAEKAKENSGNNNENQNPQPANDQNQIPNQNTGNGSGDDKTKKQTGDGSGDDANKQQTGNGNPNGYTPAIPPKTFDGANNIVPTGGLTGGYGGYGGGPLPVTLVVNNNNGAPITRNG